MVYMIFDIVEVFIEFKDLAYSVVEGVSRYSVTVIKQGEPGEDILVAIFPESDPANPDCTAECKKMATMK